MTNHNDESRDRLGSHEQMHAFVFTSGDKHEVAGSW